MFDTCLNAVPLARTVLSRRPWNALRRFLAISSVLSASLAPAADFSTYRGFRFGADIITTAKQAGLPATEATVVHRRPALLQELEWQRPSLALAETSRPDPVRSGVLHFLEGKLYRIVITYDRERMEGLTAEDMIEAFSLHYGSAKRPVAEIAFPSNYGETAKVIARWEDGTYAYNLIRTGDQSSFALVLYSKGPDTLAQSAIVESVRLELMDAPRRAEENETRRAEEGRLALEKIRAANKPNIRP